ncbi:ANTAR domain-containing protein [Lapillicoccus sp.]|uniref:ANTAR domain-containing protein n=1 Tax=Lapillicoccus sp. TaxID=1909287 RepID=UPI0025D35772|nr:ANTAR domain-containing protein [Lapillicoccus sp.]
MKVDAKTQQPLSDLAARFVDIVASVNAGGASSAVEQVVQQARSRVPGADSASITTYRRGQFTTTAASDDLSRHGDDLQYELGSGPCVDAVVDDAIYTPRDIAVDERWPEYGPRVSDELGVSSMLSFRLHTGSTESLDGLNIYSRTVGAFDEDAFLTGLFLATQASLAISRAKVENLEKALATSREIGTAIGVLMSSSKLTREQAFGLLRVASQESNRRLREVAAEVVDTGTLGPARPARAPRTARPVRPLRPAPPPRPA